MRQLAGPGSQSVWRPREPIRFPCENSPAEHLVFSGFDEQCRPVSAVIHVRNSLSINHEPSNGPIQQAEHTFNSAPWTLSC